MHTTRQSKAHSSWLARSSTLRSAAFDQDQPHTSHVANSRVVAEDVAVLVKDLHVAASRATEAGLGVLQEDAAALRRVLHEVEGVARWLRMSTNS